MDVLNQFARLYYIYFHEQRFIEIYTYFNSFKQKLYYPDIIYRNIFLHTDLCQLIAKKYQSTKQI